jgi:hypothetical protein
MNAFKSEMKLYSLELEVQKYVISKSIILFIDSK